ncbi:hypothetical protein HY768_00375 [candidate division TA06 bacterium]|uniref:SbsA Ig-like domain-containing protein n=1 Tax=candidate division TA06 bacterium TaxID=2250710 RepID=A0A933IAH5_UNCT6|nr:hypothetical protein [candidate division TA06 bacterium]
MKNRKILIGLASLLAVALFLGAGCGKKDNPLEVSTAGLNTAKAGNLPAVSSVVIKTANGDTTVQVEITFDNYMNSATIDSNNIKVYDACHYQTMGAKSGKVSYDAVAKMAIFKPNTGGFAFDHAYLLVISANVTNKDGAHLDGNGNGTYDGTPYDDKLYAFQIGSGPLDSVRTTPPTVSSTTPADGQRVAMSTQIITVNFSNGPMDTLLLKPLSNYSLKRTDNNTTVPLYLRGVTAGSVSLGINIPSDSLVVAGAKYEFRILGNTLKATADTTGVDSYLLKLDTDENGAKAVEPDYIVKFEPADTTTAEKYTYPQVNTYANAGDYYRMTFTKKMDISTFTTANIMFMDGSGYLPGEIVPDLDSIGFRYYYKRTVSGTVAPYVHMETADKFGNLLDGNNNGIGGEEGLDNWPGVSPSLKLIYPQDGASGVTNPVTFKWSCNLTDVYYYDVAVRYSDDGGMNWYLEQWFFTYHPITQYTTIVSSHGRYAWIVYAYDSYYNYIDSQIAFFTM